MTFPGHNSRSAESTALNDLAALTIPGANNTPTNVGLCALSAGASSTPMGVILSDDHLPLLAL
jgi:hypothetical protein